MFCKTKGAYKSVFFAVALTSTAALAQPLPTASPESVGMSTQRLTKISEIIRKEVSDKKLPGAVIMVARDGRLVYSEAFGGLNNAVGAPMREDSIFRLYSMTKPLVSTALMMLVEDGLVQLTDPVSKFLPSFRNPSVSVPSFNPVFNGVTFQLVRPIANPRFTISFDIPPVLLTASFLAINRFERHTRKVKCFCLRLIMTRADPPPVKWSRWSVKRHLRSNPERSGNTAFQSISRAGSLRLSVGNGLATS